MYLRAMHGVTHIDLRAAISFSPPPTHTLLISLALTSQSAVHTCDVVVRTDPVQDATL